MKKQNPLKSQITILEYKEENLHKYHISQIKPGGH